MQGKRTYAAAILCFTLQLASAQNLTAPLISGSWQSIYHNPAMTHFLPGSLTIGLPGVANDLRLENLRFNDIIRRENGRRVVDLKELSSLLDEENDVQDLFSIETFGLALRSGRFVFSTYHRLRAVGETTYPRELVDLAVSGNARSIGSTVEIAPNGGIMSWQEVGLGVSVAISDRVAIGGRIKYLAGVSSVQTAPGASLKLTTGEENYALTLEQDLTLNTVRALTYERLDQFSIIYNPIRLTPGDLTTANNGLGLDLGVAVNLDRLRLNASATDLGASIEWTEEVTSLRFSGISSFGGLDVLNDLLHSSVSFDGVVDSLVNTFEPERSGQSFTSTIEPAYFLGGEYALTDRLTTGAMAVLESRRGELAPAYALSGRYSVADWLQLGINLNYRTGIRTNLGLHLYATPGKLRFFASSDKIITLLSTGSTALAGIRLGAALSLGAERRSSSSFLP